MATKKKATQEAVAILAPDIREVIFKVRGNAPYVQNKFSAKARRQMEEAQMAEGQKRNSKAKREPKDFDDMWRQALHVTPDGWYGIPANGIRAAMVSACRITGFAMTQAKLAVFVIADGYDEDDGTPLVKITKGKPLTHKGMVRLATGVADVRWRPIWHPGWEAEIKFKYDADMFTATDVANLLVRVGMQVGIGEGRHDSKKSVGMGWGTFEVLDE